MKNTSTKPTTDSTHPRQVVQFHRSQAALAMGTSRVYPKNFNY